MLAALLVRGAAITIAPRHAYLMDHVMFMAWSDYAYEHGPTRVYDMPAAYPVWVRRDAEKIEAVSIPLQCNYPPLSTLVFWIQGMLWHRLDDQIVRGYATRRGTRGQLETVPVRSRLVNTRTSRTVNALAGMLADLLLAWGVMRLVRALRGARASRGTEVAAFALTALAPPIVIDSAFWSQSDGWVTCLLVWVVVHALRDRFWMAGALYGVALLVKTQALILAPVLVFACVVSGLRSAGTLRHVWVTLRATAAGALLVIAAVALPFSVAGGPSGAGASSGWLERSYIQPVLEQYPYTTTKAFNLWWLEGAATDGPGVLRDSRARVLGLSKDAIGRVLLAMGVLGGIVIATRRFGATPAATVAVAFLVCLAAFVLPTRVKARYIYYCLPFLIAMAFHFRPWRATLGAILTVATAELTWNLWYDAATPAAQLLSVGCAVTSVLGYVYSLATLRLGRDRTAPAPNGTAPAPDHSM